MNLKNVVVSAFAAVARSWCCFFVVLSDDLFTVDKAKIKDIQIVRTVVGGTTVYQA